MTPDQLRRRKEAAKNVIKELNKTNLTTASILFVLLVSGFAITCFNMVSLFLQTNK